MYVMLNTHNNNTVSVGKHLHSCKQRRPKNNSFSIEFPVLVYCLTCKYDLEEPMYFSGSVLVIDSMKIMWLHVEDILWFCHLDSTEIPDFFS